MRSAKIGKDPEYLDWIRTLPCRVCWHRFLWIAIIYGHLSWDWGPGEVFVQQSPTEAAHVRRRGISQMCPDAYAAKGAGGKS